MHNNEISRLFLIFFKLLTYILPIFFWILIIFGFDEPYFAILTILSALIHEGGHIAFLWLRGSGFRSIRGVVYGIKIKKALSLSYDDEILLYFSGPAANLLVATISASLSLRVGEYVLEFAAVNFATAVSNLLPIRSYDGYGMLDSMIKKHELPYVFSLVLRMSSFVLILFLCFVSLYLIDRHGQGYWIFAVFFISLLSELSIRLKR